MRLTLRTMLAYLDDILEPADAEQLGQKIEESKFAGNLVHRIRKCTRRVRLGTPPVVGRGLGGDANSVAEYLDNTLAQDRVPEFEKICLESDVHLAEVASCHQILTMVLGEPREVPADVKRRMYGLNRPQNLSGHNSRDPNNGQTEAGSPRRRGAEEPSAAEKTAAAGKRSAAGKQAPEPAAAVRDATERTLEVPDYLRPATPPKSRLVPVLATLVVTFLVALVALLAMGPINRQHPVVRLLMGADQPTEVVGSDAASPAPAGESTGERTNPEGAGSADAAATEGGASGSEAVAPVQADGPDGAATDVPREPAEGPGVPPEDDPGGLATRPQPVPPVVPNGPEAAPAGGEPGAARPGLPSDAGPAVRPATHGEAGDAGARPPVGTPLPGEPAVLPPAGLPGDPAFPPPGLIAGVPQRPEPPPVAAPAAGVDVAHLISDSQLLVRYQPENESWLRVPPNGAIFAGEYLGVLPTFRPQLLLASGIKATLSGPATAMVEATEGPGGLRIRLMEGRLLLMTVGKLGAQIPLDLAGRRGLVTFHDVDSALAVDVRRVLPPGADPEANAAWLEARLYAPSGRLSWQEGGPQDAAPELALMAGQVAVLQADRAVAVQSVSELPAWIDPRTSLTAMDRKTSETIEPLIETNRSVRLALMELCEHRQLDVRSLAARCLAHLGDFGPLVDQLSDERQKAYWDKGFESLRTGVVRGPTEAAQLRKALERKVPERAAILYRLMWGFSPDQLRAGEAAKLVDYLEHPEMDVRVVAFQNLKWITGGVTLLYRPEAQVSDERSKLLRWRERLEAGEIRWEEAN